MVDVAVTNSKLEDRALRTRADLAGVSRDQGRALLEASGGSVKLALVMAQRSLDLTAACQLLENCGGKLRRALSA